MNIELLDRSSVTESESSSQNGVGSRLRALKGATLTGAAAAVLLATAACGSSSGSDSSGESDGDEGGVESAAANEEGGSPGEGEDDLGFSQLSNGHQHDQGNEPLTEEEEATLARQLAPTEDLMEEYPTLADAEAAGYMRAGPFAPGLGTHYMPPFDASSMGDVEATTDPVDLDPLLIYDGVEPDAELAGFMFSAPGGEEPEGFAGSNDHWHYHEKVCVKFGADGVEVPFGADRDDVTQKMCDDVDGRFIENTGYMVHVWNVPGYESPQGMFHELNSKITCPDGTYYRLSDEEQTGKEDSICLDA